MRNYNESKKIRYAETLFSVVANENDILLVWDGSVGLAFTDVKGVVGSTVMRVTPIGIMKKYLFYFLQSKYEYFKNNKVGDTIPHINPQLFYSLEVPLPPIQEQERIVKKLEEKLNDYQKDFTNKEQELAKLEATRQSVLERAVSGELTEDWREENNVEFNWESKKLETIASISGGKRLPKDTYLVDKDFGFYYIKAGNLKNGSIIDENIGFLNDITYREMSNYYVNEGDVYLTIVGSKIGETGIIPKKYNSSVLTENAVRIYNLLNLDNKYLYFLLKSNFGQKIIQNSIHSSAQGKLAIYKIRNFMLPIPSLPEQTEIVNRVEKLLKKADEAEAKYQQAMKMIDKLQTSVLAMAFCGELSEPQPNDEPVSVLLEKIKTEKARLEQERNEMQKQQSQIKRTMAKQEKVVKSVLDLLRESETKSKTVEEIWQESEYKEDKEVELFLDSLDNLEKEGKIKIEFADKPLNIVTKITLTENAN